MFFLSRFKQLNKTFPCTTTIKRGLNTQKPLVLSSRLSTKQVLSEAIEECITNNEENPDICIATVSGSYEEELERFPSLLPKSYSKCLVGMSYKPRLSSGHEPLFLSLATIKVPENSEVVTFQTKDASFPELENFEQLVSANKPSNWFLFSTPSLFKELPQLNNHFGTIFSDSAVASVKNDRTEYLFMKNQLIDDGIVGFGVTFDSQQRSKHFVSQLCPLIFENSNDGIKFHFNDISSNTLFPLRFKKKARVSLPSEIPIFRSKDFVLVPEKRVKFQLNDGHDNDVFALLEPRGRIMLSRCLSQNIPFGVIENSTSFGTIAVIEEVSPGEFQIRGVSRFREISSWREPFSFGLEIANVEYLEESEGLSFEEEQRMKKELQELLNLTDLPANLQQDLWKHTALRAENLEQKQWLAMNQRERMRSQLTWLKEYKKEQLKLLKNAVFVRIL